jgi:hypothetical protein
MIGMAIVPIRDRNGARSHASNQPRRLPDLILPADSPIGPRQILAPGRTQDDSGGFRFGQPLVWRPVTAHLAACEIAQPDLMTERGVLGDRATDANFDVVRMRSEHQQVGAHLNSAHG